ncbi:unnamed protein product [Heligmosomoides polygyrus]|uniref:MFS transporter n=1 Tax=Heligmosomoides polygyrus TaxID=6339 RepID=A0A183GQH6_HELPZ|nr:unnamed protein product [Heligmosomoides polygyrus]
MPYVVLTLMAALDTVFYQWVIPETKGKPLPENLPQKDPVKAKLARIDSLVKV